ncbi:MAG: TrkH family potassium uptake protein [Eubacteriales bacterium]|nr:TrkH family potassium uptake protein [Eubacteriales bacterium]
MNDKNEKIFVLGPAHIITFSFLALILIGTLLLNLPISSVDGKSIGIFNAMFTATSAVCVTGLVVVNTLNHWTIFGKVIILMLIQIGALGFMSLFTFVLVFLGRKITLKERILIQESFNLSSFKGLFSFLKKIIKGTFIIEGIGSLILSIRFIPKYGFPKGILYGIFHSVSAFCNAGFDILGEASLLDYQTDYIVNITIMAVIILGGLGFSVWIDLLKYINHLKDKRSGKINSKFVMSLHSKVALCMTSILIFLGFISTFLLEFNNPETIGNLRLDQKILACLFQSVTLRTAGFDAIGQAELNYGSKFMAIILMAIGGSPGGTAGGIKTVTIGALFFTIVSVIKGKDCVTAFKKTISFHTVQKALTVFVMMITFIFLATILLSITELNNSYNHDFIDLLYEATSALGTVGLSTGITQYLSFFGRIIIMVCMFVGRLGPITVVLGLSFQKRSKKNVIHYPEEKIIVG